MERMPPRLTLFLGLFSGICVSAAWFSVRPDEIVGAICIGTAVCATLLIALRFDRALVRKSRRRTDLPPHAGEAVEGA